MDGITRRLPSATTQQVVRTYASLDSHSSPAT
jgi:hypothetical protein